LQVTEQEERVLAETLRMLGSGVALSQDLESYVIGFHVLGNLVATAQGEYELLEQQRKIEWARSFTNAKVENKISDKTAEAIADITVDSLRKKEIRAKEKLTMLKGTRDSVQEAIWAIKSLNKAGG
jgi:hypothetical protein